VAYVKVGIGVVVLDKAENPCYVFETYHPRLKPADLLLLPASSRHLVFSA
jgi:hypothetical protein